MKFVAFLGPNVYLSTLYTDCFLYCFLKVRDHFSETGRTRGKVIVSHVCVIIRLVYNFLASNAIRQTL